MSTDRLVKAVERLAEAIELLAEQQAAALEAMEQTHGKPVPAVVDTSQSDLDQ